MLEGRSARKSSIAALSVPAALLLIVGAALLAAPSGWAAALGAAAVRQRQGGQQRPASLQIGDPAPEAVLETLDGDRIWTSQLRGKVVVLDFWATWCGPCVAALPGMKQLARTHAGKPFALVSISGDANGARLREFVVNHELGWTQCWDGNAVAQRAYGVRGFPTYFLIDQAGRVRAIKAGWDRGFEKELGSAVDKLLSGGAAQLEPAAGRR
jgi:thiol-disulfide isomerase/thioredoxin